MSGANMRYVLSRRLCLLHDYVEGLAISDYLTLISQWRYEPSIPLEEWVRRDLLKLGLSLRRISVGRGRAVFPLVSQGIVLKVAINSYGVHANRKEQQRFQALQRLAGAKPHFPHTMWVSEYSMVQEYLPQCVRRVSDDMLHFARRYSIGDLHEHNVRRRPDGTFAFIDWEDELS